MKNKSRRKLTTIFGLIPLLVLMFGIVGGVAYALVSGTRAKTEHGFQVSVRGAVNVSANIVGKSYHNNILKERLEIVSFDGTQEQELSKTQNFNDKLNIDTKEDKVSYVFEITNTTMEEKYTDLIVEPNYTLTNAGSNVVSNIFYSTDNSLYEEYVHKYFVIEKGQKAYIKLEISITEIDEASDILGLLEFDLYTEDAKPADFGLNNPEAKFEGEVVEGKNEIIITNIVDKTATDVVIPDEIEGVPVTTIAANAFEGMENIKTIVIGENIKTIEEYAFYGTSVEEIVLPDSVESINNTFYYMPELKSVTIGKNLKTMSDLEFAFTDNLETIVIDEENEYFKVENNAIVTKNEFTRLETVINDTTYAKETIEVTNPANTLLVGTKNTTVIPEGIVRIAPGAFYANSNIESVSIPNTLTEIGYAAFYRCSSLKTIDLTKATSLTKIDDLAFMMTNAFSLEEVRLPNTVTYIGYRAFANNKALKSIDLGSSIETIDNEAFLACSVLDTITYAGEEKSETLKNIGHRSFTQCGALEYISIPDNVEKIQEFGVVFNYKGLRYKFSDKETLRCEGLIDLTLTEFNVVSMIGDKPVIAVEYATNVAFNDTLEKVVVADGVQLKSTFIGCDNLRSVTLGTGVTNLPNNAFKDCTSLVEVVATSVVNIGDQVFYSCSSLEHFEFPASLKTIGKSTFSGARLKEVIFNDGLTEVGQSAFSFCYYLEKIYIPSSVSFYVPEDEVITQYPFYYAGYKASSPLKAYVEDVEAECDLLEGWNRVLTNKYIEVVYGIDNPNEIG